MRLALRDYNQAILNALFRPPSPGYWAAVLFCFTVIGWGAFCWGYQICEGMGVIGINHPIGWGTYIANFVFWIGLGHAGTLISAILFLFRVRWRNAIFRSAEAMTVFAVMTAGLFPLLHLGRVWIFFFILPYPNQRHVWPNFKSPLVWDVMAVSTYLTISILFWYAGMLPDLAAARDNSTGLRHKVYRFLAAGWTGAHEQWRHYLRAYMGLAAITTPLVISVHSVVSFDFSMALLPGWHTTIFAPYFVAGAIHSGLALVVILLILIRYFLDLKLVIRREHLEQAALLMILTGSIMGYSYGCEAFINWYSADTFERQFAAWRSLTGWPVAYWLMIWSNVVAPLLFFYRPFRTRTLPLLILSGFVVFGMWLERYVIVITATAHDFMPENWSRYIPRWPEISIGLASIAWFSFYFLLYSKFLPVASIAENKEPQVEQQLQVVTAE